MTMWFALAIGLLGLLATAQTTNTPPTTAAAILVLPRSGMALSFEQIEERWRRLGDGASVVEVINSRTYRDHSGRVRMESDIRDSSRQVITAYALLIDPVKGSRVVLLSAEKIAYRTPFPTSTEGRFAFFGTGGDAAASSHKWNARTENTGKRTIEGIECEGTRIIQSVEGEPGLTKTVEQWYSDELKLIAFLGTSAGDETYRARIQNLRREEPDPALFVIPADYNTIDVPLPSPDHP